MLIKDKEKHFIKTEISTRIFISINLTIFFAKKMRSSDFYRKKTRKNLQPEQKISTIFDHLFHIFALV